VKAKRQRVRMDGWMEGWRGEWMDGGMDEKAPQRNRLRIPQGRQNSQKP